MKSLTEVIARFRDLHQSNYPKPSRPSSDRLKTPWRRSSRTKVNLASKAAAVEKAVRILEASGVRYSQPLLGKLVIEPPPGTASAVSVTFWPARKRLRLRDRPTKREQDLHDLEAALADQGHHILGQPFRVPKSREVLRWERFQAEREDQLRQQLADLEEAECAYAEKMGLHRERIVNRAAGRSGGRNPRATDIGRRFSSAIHRATQGRASARQGDGI